MLEDILESFAWEYNKATKWFKKMHESTPTFQTPLLVSDAFGNYNSKKARGQADGNKRRRKTIQFIFRFCRRLKATIYQRVHAALCWAHTYSNWQGYHTGLLIPLDFSQGGDGVSLGVTLSSGYNSENKSSHLKALHTSQRQKERHTGCKRLQDDAGTLAQLRMSEL